MSNVQRKAVIFRHHLLDYTGRLEKTPVIVSATSQALFVPDFKRGLEEDLQALRAEHLRVLG